jgi:amino acid permease
MLTCLFSGSVAAFGLYLLSLCAKLTPHRKSSFFAVAQLTFPSAAVFFDAAIAIKCFGVSIRSVSQQIMAHITISERIPATSLSSRV